MYLSYACLYSLYACKVLGLIPSRDILSYFSYNISTFSCNCSCGNDSFTTIDVGFETAL